MCECDNCLFQTVSVDKYDGTFVESCGAGYDTDHNGECDSYSKDESV